MKKKESIFRYLNEPENQKLIHEFPNNFKAYEYSCWYRGNQITNFGIYILSKESVCFILKNGTKAIFPTDDFLNEKYIGKIVERILEEGNFQIYCGIKTFRNLLWTLNQHKKQQDEI